MSHPARRNSIVLALALAGPFAATQARADQCAYTTKAQAEAAKTFVTAGMVLREYCEPCGDKDPAASKAVVVTDVAIRETGFENTWELVVNGTGYDLAYTFVPHKGRYVNLASLAKCDAHSVSTQLDLPVPPPAAPAPKVTPAPNK